MGDHFRRRIWEPDLRTALSLATAKKENGGISADILSGYALVVGHVILGPSLLRARSRKRLAPELLLRPTLLISPDLRAVHRTLQAGCRHKLRSAIDHSRAGLWQDRPVRRRTGTRFWPARRTKTDYFLPLREVTVWRIKHPN